jgi:hypothetical protein
MRLTTQLVKQQWIPPHTRVRKAGIMLAVSVLVAMGVGNGRLKAQGLSPGEKETEIVRGTVVNSMTGEPIGRALVFSPDNRFAMMSDAGGHFEFKIPPAKSEPESGNASEHITISNGAHRPWTGTNGPNALMARKPGFVIDENYREGILPNEGELAPKRPPA